MRGTRLERVDRIWNHPEYQRCLEEIRICEKDRIFCRHTPEHFLDVARITCLLAWERGLDVDRETIYAAALLLDIGRHLQYRERIPHEQASARIAEGILADCGFAEEEQAEILHLIRSHRTKTNREDLTGLFYRADKLSRSCFSCPARDLCDWPEEKKNQKITY